MDIEEQRAKRAQYQRAYIQRLRSVDPERFKELRRQHRRNRIAKNPEKARAQKIAESARWRERKRQQRAQDSRLAAEHLAKRRLYERSRKTAQVTVHGPFAGSVVAASAPSIYRDLLLDLTQRCPKADDREEIVAEAALLVIEGMSVDDALKTARRNVFASSGLLRYSKPIEDCFWL